MLSGLQKPIYTGPKKGNKPEIKVGERFNDTIYR